MLINKGFRDVTKMLPKYFSLVTNFVKPYFISVTKGF